MRWRDPDTNAQGLNVYAVGAASGDVLGEFAESSLGEGLQIHPDCDGRVTHTGEHTRAWTSDSFDWSAPASLSEGDEVLFMVTVVRSYDTWFAFESGPHAVAGVSQHAKDLIAAGLVEKKKEGVHAPGTKAPGVRAPGAKAPGRSARKAAAGGNAGKVVRPPKTGDEGSAQIAAQRAALRLDDGKRDGAADPLTARRHAAIRTGAPWLLLSAVLGGTAAPLRRWGVPRALAAACRAPPLAAVGVVALLTAVGAYNDGSLFAIHPIAMTAAFTLCMSEASRAASRAIQLPPGAERLAALQRHGWLMAASLLFAAVGYWAIYANKERLGKPHVTSEHAVVGIAALAATGLNAAVGVLAFKHLGLSDMLPRDLLPPLKRVHRAFGLATLLAGLAALSLGAGKAKGGGSVAYMQPVFAAVSAIAAIWRAGPTFGRPQSGLKQSM